MWGIEAARVRGWLEAGGLLALDLPRGSWVARAFVEALIATAAIDGHVDAKERALLIRVTKQRGRAADAAGSLVAGGKAKNDLNSVDHIAPKVSYLLVTADNLLQLGAYIEFCLDSH